MSTLPLIPTGALMLVDSAPGSGEGILQQGIELATTPRKIYAPKWAKRISDPELKQAFLEEFQKAQYSHVELISRGGVLARENRNSIKTCGDTWPVVVERDLLTFKGCRVWIVMPKYYSFLAAEKMMEEARGRCEEKYDLWALLAHLLDYALNNAVYYATLKQLWPDWRAFASLPIFKSGVCSWFVADLYDRYFNVNFYRKPSAVTPADIQRAIWLDLNDPTSPSTWDSLYRGVIQ